MRYRLEANVKSTIRLPASFSIPHSGLDTEFIADDSGHLVALAAGVQVRPEDFAATFRPGVIEISGDAEIHQGLIRHLQALESHLSFSSGGALTRVHWDTAKQERIPEAPEEEGFATVRELRQEFGHRDEWVTLQPSAAKLIVEACSGAGELVVPKAMYRQGESSFRDRRYIQAYYSFYFVLEDFFARGRSSEAAVLKEFKRSQTLREVTGIALKTSNRYPRHVETLVRFYEQHRCQPDIDGTYRLLVRLRGRLHHYFGKSQLPGPNPFVEDIFETPAFLCLLLSSLTIMNHDEALPHVSSTPNGVLR